jgi:3-oxoacyl-[acyl-carrier protein] reductase
MNYNFADKVVVVTGGGKGIGKTIVKKFSEYGAKTVIADIDWELAQEVEAEMTKEGREAFAIKVDVSKTIEVEGFIAKVLKRYKQIDVLVNNAGIVGYRGPIVNHPEESWDKVLNINLKGTFLCCKSVLPHMLTRKTGIIVNMGSMAGSYGGTPAVGVDYSVSKAAIHCLTKRIATETADKGIRVNALAPHAIKTEMFNDIPEAFYNKLVNTVKMGRLAEPDEVAKVILFLASDDSSFITGQTIHVDGGSIYGD